MPITANGQTYTDDQIKNFFANAPTNDAVAKQAASLGLNQGQIQQAMQIGGQNVSTGDITDYASKNGYSWGSNGGLIQGAQQTTAPSAMTIGGKNYTSQQIKDFYANGGNDNQFAQEAGLIDPDQRRAAILQARGIAGAGTMAGESGLQNYFNQYKQFNPSGAFANDYNGWINDVKSNPHVYDAMRSGTYTGTPFASQDWAPNGIYGPGTGHDFTFKQGRNGAGAHGTGDGFGAWTGAAGETSGGIIGSASGVAPASTSGTPGTSSGGIIGNASASGSTSPGVWNVDGNQLVANQFNNLIDPNSALMQKARTQALERMNERGLLNSSIATGAADSAMYDAALGIAKQDAGTYADAAKSNAGSQTSWAIAANNNATSKDVAASNVTAQKELTQATQLYNNLANQTASASTIQTWGLNTITSIMGSDMSAEAKNAAVAQIKTYLSDSYQIQGDWHTSAAQAIDAIFG